MSVISRQFAKDILLSTIFVLIVLIALFAFFDLIGQLDDLGADYTIGRAFLTTSLTLPSRAYEVMPLSFACIGLYDVKVGIHFRIHCSSRIRMLSVAPCTVLAYSGGYLRAGDIRIRRDRSPCSSAFCSRSAFGNQCIIVDPRICIWCLGTRRY